MLKVVKYQIGASDVFIEERDQDSWAIVRYNSNLTKNQEWIKEPSPSNRDVEFLSLTRFKNPEEALQIYLSTL